MKDVDGSGRTFVHSKACENLGQPSKNNGEGTEGRVLQGCTGECKVRHAAQSLRTGIVQMLVNGYQSLGVKDVWDPENRTGNPATAKEIKQYIQFSMKEQLQAGITPKQAAVILRQEFETLIQRMRASLFSIEERENSLEELVIRRDMAIFAVAFSSTKRGESLCNLLIAKILQLPDWQA
jgi:hypothetical protein